MTANRIIHIISEQFNIPTEDIKMETSFREDLNADSLDLVELIMALEDEFGIELDDDNLEKIETVADAKKYIMSEIV